MLCRYTDIHHVKEAVSQAPSEEQQRRNRYRHDGLTGVGDLTDWPAMLDVKGLDSLDGLAEGGGNGGENTGHDEEEDK